ncbi:MAG: AraC family transcriptional regulator [Candidatus Dormibacteria bacterium]
MAVTPDAAAVTGVRVLLPSPWLTDYVRCYHYTEMHLGRSELRKLLTARPEQMMQFSLGRPFTIVDQPSGTSSEAPDVVLVGRHTRRNLDLVATGTLATLTVHFQPGGFYRLFHMPILHLTDLAPDAEDVIGSKVRVLHERVRTSSTPHEMVGHVEAMLQERLDGARPFHLVQAAAEWMLTRPGGVDVAALAAASQLSTRQFERTFVVQVGVPPKLFSQVVRFAHALESKKRQPQRTWAEIAADVGYYDQMHLVRECHRFGGSTPSALIETWIDCAPGGRAEPMSRLY